MISLQKTSIMKSMPQNLWAQLLKMVCNIVPLVVNEKNEFKMMQSPGLCFLFSEHNSVLYFS